MIFMRKHNKTNDQFFVQHFSTLTTRWQQSFRPALHYACGSFVCQTWLHPVISTSSPEHSLTCCPCVYIPPSQFLKKNLITWLTECSGGMSCGCELGWKRNIHKLNLSINSLTVWDTTLWVSGGGGIVCRMRIFLFIFWTRYFLEFGTLSEAGKVGLRCGAPPAVQSIFKYVWALLSQYCWNCVNQNFQIP